MSTAASRTSDSRSRPRDVPNATNPATNAAGTRIAGGVLSSSHSGSVDVIVGPQSKPIAERCQHQSRQRFAVVIDERGRHVNAVGSTQPLARRLGRYDVFYLVAQGGVTSVYLAQLLTGEGFKKSVALKTGSRPAMR